MSIRCIAVFSLFYRRDAIAPWSLKGDTRITIIRVVEGGERGIHLQKNHLHLRQPLQIFDFH